jgi:hypothetical protein
LGELPISFADPVKFCALHFIGMEPVVVKYQPQQIAKTTSAPADSFDSASALNHPAIVLANGRGRMYALNFFANELGAKR